MCFDKSAEFVKSDVRTRCLSGCMCEGTCRVNSWGKVIFQQPWRVTSEACDMKSSTLFV